MSAFDLLENLAPYNRLDEPIWLEDEPEPSMVFCERCYEIHEPDECPGPFWD